MRSRTVSAVAILAFVPALAALACAATEPGRSSTGRVETRERTRTVRPGEAVELAVGESVALAGETRAVTFVRVAEDSRCPRGVTCVWAGRAVVELALALPGRPAETVRLVVGEPPPAGAAGALELAALALEPAPRAGVATRAEDYRLRLRVGPAGGVAAGKR